MKKWFELQVNESGATFVYFKESSLIGQNRTLCSFNEQSLRGRISSMKKLGEDTSFEEEALAALLADTTDMERVSGKQ